MATERGTFKSHFGILIAIIGSAIGFGNFWRFPYMTGENGGGAFILIYIAIALLLGVPLIASEYLIGKSTHKDFVDALKDLRKGSRWYLIGYLTQITVVLVLSFYSVIGGWTFHAIIDTIANIGIVRDAEITRQSFGGFVDSGWKSILLTFVFLAISSIIVSRGIHSGIEKYNKILIPVLFIVLIVMGVYSMTLTGFSKSIEYLFTPNFSAITVNTILSAFGQVFFSMSVGMGIYATYASYSESNENILKDQAVIVFGDTSVAILASIIIFSAVFTFGINPSEGPTLVFIALPSLFSQMTLGSVIAILFFVSLTIAAITSAVALIEVLVTGFVDQYGISRKKACLVIFLLEAVLSALCALSQAEGFNINIMGLCFFDFLDTLTANWMLTTICLLTSVFVGWIADKKRIRETIVTGNGITKRLYIPYIFIVKYIIPTMVIILVINKIWE